MILKRLSLFPAALTLVLRATPSVFAQQASPSPAPEAVDVEEVVAYQAWTAASTTDPAKAAELAQAYLEKYPKGQYSEYLSKWLVGVQWNQFNEAIKKKDIAEMVRIGQKRLAVDPQDINFLYWMALNLRQHELLGSPEPAHTKEARDFSRRAIDLVGSGARPVGVDPAKWNKDANLAWLHQNLALLAAKAGDDKEALAQYETSSALAPKDAGILARNSLGCATIHKAAYDAAAARYQAVPEAERSGETPSPAAREALDAANQEADAAVQCWARFLGVTKGSAATEELRSKVEAALAAVYKYRHPDEPEGYKALVDGFVLKP
jgi:hypothetical protein